MRPVRVHILEARLDLNRYTECGIAYRSCHLTFLALRAPPQLFWLSVFHAPQGHVLLGSGN